MMRYYFFYTLISCQIMQTEYVFILQEIIHNVLLTGLGSNVLLRNALQ